MERYRSALSVLKYAGLALATVAAIWSALGVGNKGEKDKINTGKADSVAIALTMVGFFISISSNILEDRLKIKQDKADAIAEIKKTNKIILAGQPLTQLNMEWQFKGVDENIIKFITAQQKQIISDYNDAFYNVDMRLDSQSLLNEYYLLYPFINLVIENKADAELGKNILALISLDNTQNVVLPIGQLSADVKGYENEIATIRQNKQLYSGGIRFIEDLTSFWDNATGSNDTSLRITRPMNDFPRLEADGNNVNISWNLDPFTFYNAIDRQSPGVAITADLPNKVKVLLLNQIDTLPFAGTNLAIPHECYPWQADQTNGSAKSPIYISSAISLVPNGLDDEKVTYDLKSSFSYPITDFWGDDNTCGVVQLIYEK